MMLILEVLKDEIAEFAYRADPNEVTHNEPPHLDLHCLPSKYETAKLKRNIQ